MKKNFTHLITSLLFVFASNTSFAQWTTGTDIHNTNSGNVGIGISTPQENLSIAGSTASVGLYRNLGGSTPSVNNYMGTFNWGLYDPTTSTTTISARIRAITTEIWTTGTAQGTGLSFYTTKNGTSGNAEMMRLDNSGNLGLGTTTPTSQLTLSGKTGRIASFGIDAAITDDISASFAGDRAQFGYHSSTVNAVVQGGGGKGIEFNVNNNTFGSGTAMVIGSNSNVGIGAIAPATHLSVNSNANATGTIDLSNSITIGSLNANATSKYLGQFGFLSNDDSFSAPKTVAYISGEATETYDGNTKTGSAMRFFTGSNGDTKAVERMVIDNNGNVGIGTPSPQESLSIANYSGTATAGFYRNLGGSTPSVNNYMGTLYFGLFDPTTNTTTRTARINAITTEIWTTGTAQGTALSFYTTKNGTTSSAETMRLDDSGNLGIGTTNPTSQLTLSGKTGRVANFGVDGSEDQSIYAGFGNSRALFGYNGSSHNATIQSGASKGLEFNVSNSTFGSGTAMLIKTNGKVGIGTINPDEALTVAGNVHTKEVLVDLDIPTPDYVFNAAYQLPSLAEVRAYINTNHHLQDIPSAAEVDKNGLKLGQMNMALLKKVEELTLYMLDKDQQIKSQQDQIDQLKKDMQALLKAKQ